MQWMDSAPDRSGTPKRGEGAGHDIATLTLRRDDQPAGARLAAEEAARLLGAGAL